MTAKNLDIETTRNIVELGELLTKINPLIDNVQDRMGSGGALFNDYMTIYSDLTDVRYKITELIFRLKNE